MTLTNTSRRRSRRSSSPTATRRRSVVARSARAARSTRRSAQTRIRIAITATIAMAASRDPSWILDGAKAALAGRSTSTSQPTDGAVP